MSCTPFFGEITTATFAVLFIVPLFDVNFRGFFLYFNMFLWPDLHSPLLDNIETCNLKGENSQAVFQKVELNC